MLKVVISGCLILHLAQSHYSSSSSEEDYAKKAFSKPNYLGGKSDEDDDCYEHVFGDCPEIGGWKSAPFMCWNEETHPMNFYDAINYGIKLAVDQNNPYVKLMPVGKLRKFERIYKTRRHIFKDVTHFRVNAIKSQDGTWREFPSGLPVDFHHFPRFDPQSGEPGDTLTWYPTNHLNIADKNEKHPALFYQPKSGVCQNCPDFEKAGYECSNAGDCWRGFCACDDGYSGFKCQDGPLPYIQIITVGGEDNGNILQEPLIAYLPEAQTEQCTGEALLPIQVSSPVGEWFNGQIIICGGHTTNSITTDLCHVFDRSQQKWKIFHSLNEKRTFAASEISPNGDFFIAGGFSGGTLGVVLDSVEILRKNGDDSSEEHDHHFMRWRKGPPMPEPLMAGQLIAINNCEMAYIGGINSNMQPSEKIYILNCHSQSWTRGPDLYIARNNFGVTKLKDPRDDRWKIVIAGGRVRDSVYTRTVELWDLTRDEVYYVNDDSGAMADPWAALNMFSISDYKAIALGGIYQPGASTVYQDFIWSFSLENGWIREVNLTSQAQHQPSNLGYLPSMSAMFITEVGFFHCNYEPNILTLV